MSEQAGLRGCELCMANGTQPGKTVKQAIDEYASGDEVDSSKRREAIKC